ncbi:hypothetical protein ACW2QC_04790 [Virgibacillus sp. FSP13]
MPENRTENKKYERKFAWIDKWVKMTGDRARIDAKANDTCIVYETEKGIVQEYPDGKVIKLDQKSYGEKNETN